MLISSAHASCFPRVPGILLLHGVQAVVLEPFYQCTVKWSPSTLTTWHSCGHSPAYFGMSTRTKSSLLIGLGFVAVVPFPITTFFNKTLFLESSKMHFYNNMNNKDQVLNNLTYWWYGGFFM